MKHYPSIFETLSKIGKLFENNIRFEIKKMILGIVMLSIMAICSYQKKIAFDLINILICILVLFVFDKDIIIIIFKALFNKKIEKNRRT